MPDTTTITLTDIAAQARALYGPEKAEAINPGLPAEDWRFEVRLPSGAKVTMHSGATAQYVAAYLQREGVLTGEATR